MGIAKKTDGRYVVGMGVTDANDYKGSASYRDIYIQLTADGATEESVEYLTYLKDYAAYHSGLGEPIMPPSVNVWISNNGVTTAVEADDLALDGDNFTICGIKWDGSSWDYSDAGKGGGGGGSSLPPYTLADEGKVLTVKKEVAGEVNIFNEDLAFLNHDNEYIMSPLTPSQIEPFLALSEGDSVVIDFDDESIDCNVIYDSNSGNYFIIDADEYIGVRYNAENGGFASVNSNLPSGTYNFKVKSNEYVASADWNKENPYLVLKAVSYIGNLNNTDYYSVNLTYEDVKAAFEINNLKPVFVAVPRYNHEILYESPLVLQVNRYDYSGDYFACMLDSAFTLNYDDIIGVSLTQYNHPTLGLIFVMAVQKQPQE